MERFGKGKPLNLPESMVSTPPHHIDIQPLLSTHLLLSLWILCACDPDHLDSFNVCSKRECPILFAVAVLYNSIVGEF